MKILYILDNLSKSSGVSSVAIELYRHLSKRNITIDFLVSTKKKNSYEKEILEMGSKIFYSGNYLSVKESLKAIRFTKKFFNKNGSDYDIVHLHSPTIALFTLKYAQKANIKSRIVHSHSTMMTTSKFKNLIHHILLPSVKKYGNIFWACSTEAGIFLYGEEFHEENKIEIINNAVDCDNFYFDKDMRFSTRTNLKVNQEKLFIHISNYNPLKNHFFLLDVIEKLKNNGNRVKFIFVGEGPTKNRFITEIETKNLKNMCVFLNQTTDITKYLCAADAIILPSKKEGLPVTLVEAQATGLPFFTSDSVTKEVCVGSGTFLPLEKEIWYKELEEFNPVSIETRNLAAETFYLTKFNIRNEANRVEKLYESLLKQGDIYEKK